MGVIIAEGMKNTSNTIIKYFTGKQHVLAVYLFGSAAKSLMRKNSDIDIALLLEENKE